LKDRTELIAIYETTTELNITHPIIYSRTNQLQHQLTKNPEIITLTGHSHALNLRASLPYSTPPIKLKTHQFMTLSHSFS
jgi:hypothetical protein